MNIPQPGSNEGRTLGELSSAATLYETLALAELHVWQKKMQRAPSWANRTTRGLQQKLNRLIPQKVHDTITTMIKQMTRGILFGAEKLSPDPLLRGSLEQRETLVRKKIELYRRLGATEGGLTGAGGLLLGLADFPLLLSLKFKLLFDIAAIYGFNTSDYRERLFTLHIFQLAFAGQQHRNNVYPILAHWQEYQKSLPEDIHRFNWYNFQQEYRDYIDLAKMAQLIPLIGAPVGAIVNYRLMKQLGETAMQAYRSRYQQAGWL
jgi:EcsC protein family